MPDVVNFPTTSLTPNVSTYTLGNRTWKWNGAAWEIVAQTATGYTGSLGYTGSAGTNGYTGSQGNIGYTGSSASASPFAACNTSNIVSTGASIGTSDGGTGTHNFFVGCLTGCANTTGKYNTFIGNKAGCKNTTGNNNTYIGFEAGKYSCTSSNNIIVGNSAGKTLGKYGADNDNIFLGAQSGAYSFLAQGNFFAGYRAGRGAGIGQSHSTIIGYEAGRYGNGACNIFIGLYSGCQNIGSHNVFLGGWTGRSSGGGSHNFFAGLKAGCSNTTGCYNTFIGKYAGCSSTTNCNNTFIGKSAGFSNTTGNNNVTLGQESGYCLTTGCHNIFAGQCAGYCNTTGTNNIFLGQNAGKDLTATASCQIVLKAGSNELKVSTAGSLTLNGSVVNAGPAFSAYANNSTQTITSGSQQKVLFQVEEFDTNNNYASSTFTPTVAGYYQLNAEVRLDGASGTGEMMIVIWKNGSEYKRGTNQSGTQIAANFWAMQVSSLVYANGSTDYFEIYVQQVSGSSITVTAVNSANITWFNGSMVRGA
jgi:hypothetical protein